MAHGLDPVHGGPLYPIYQATDPIATCPIHGRLMPPESAGGGGEGGHLIAEQRGSGPSPSPEMPAVKLELPPGDQPSVPPCRYATAGGAPSTC